MKTINISGVIGWDTTAKELRDELVTANGADVEIIVSSPGGFVAEGIEMFNLIRNYKGNTTARLSGYAMSMASYVPLAAKRIVAEDNAIYMIHNVRGGAYGDHNAMIKYGETMRGMSRLLARAYEKRTGKTAEEIEQMMDKETFFFGQDMIDHGFVDEIIETQNDKDRESSVAVAFSAYHACCEKMTADASATSQDLQKAAAIFSATGNIPTERKEMVMTLDTLRADHPEIVTAIEAEAKVGMVTAEEVAQLVAAAKEEGAQSERDRIADVRSKLVKGHEALIEALCADGKSTGADACAAIVAAEQAQRTAYIEAKGNDPVDVVVDEVTAVTGSADERWEKDANLRAEFSNNKAAFIAYEKSIEAGHARILKK